MSGGVCGWFLICSITIICLRFKLNLEFTVPILFFFAANPAQAKNLIILHSVVLRFTATEEHITLAPRDRFFSPTSPFLC